MFKASFQERAKNFKNQCGIKLLELMARKQTNLCVAVDVISSRELLEIAEKLGPFICILKTHVDIITDFTLDFTIKLKELANKFDFMIFEDRKFADIGNTVSLQYSQGIYRISDWSDFTNCHPIPGDGIVQGLKQIGLPLGRGLLILAEMSSKGSLATGNYTMEAIKMAERHTDFCFGFIGQNRIETEHDFLYLTPGVALDAQGDSLGQQYRTPHQVILESGCDIIIVGRGIYKGDVVENAKRYQKAGWDAYCDRLKQHNQNQ